MLAAVLIFSFRQDIVDFGRELEHFDMSVTKCDHSPGLGNEAQESIKRAVRIGG